MLEPADRSSMEVKNLLRKLHPKFGSSHKDRVRLLNKFQKYVSGSTATTTRKSSAASSASPAAGSSSSQVTTPEFYDDDLPLLLLGNASTIAKQDEELSVMNLYGLLQACGAPSTDHGQQKLKRSARNAMGLLKYLVCDFVERVNGKPVPLKVDPVTGLKELNGFSYALCCCTVDQLKFMNLELHIMDHNRTESRGGAKEDACHVLVLLVTRHLTENGEQPSPVGVDDLLTSPTVRQSFENWLKTAPRETQQAVRKARVDQKNRESAAAAAKAAGGDDDDEEEGEDDILGAFKKKKKKKRLGGTEEEIAAEIAAEEHKEEKLEGLGLDLYKPVDTPDGDGLPTRWVDSHLSREAQLMTSDAMAREAERENAEHEMERKRQLEEKERLVGRDPLGIRGGDFDLRIVQENRVELLEQAVADIDEALDEEAEGVGSKKGDIVSLEAQREALVSIMDGPPISEDSDEEDEEALDTVENKSILPTDPNFDPVLFLTLVHPTASFEQLQDSIQRLSSKTENQVQHIQNLVRDNFELFVKCADGIDVFSEGNNNKAKKGSGVKERLNKLDALAESCSYQARKSFKPLLDNTNEVRKVQSALAVLHRVGPLLQVPIIMRQHVENARFSAAIKAYRKVLVIDDDNKVLLLRHVKLKAAEAARDARRYLEATLANHSVSVTTLLDAIRDLGELIELDVPPDPNETLDEEEEGDGHQEEEKSSRPPSSTAGAFPEEFGRGTFTVGGKTIKVRDYSPALSCLLLQSAYFSNLVERSVRHAEIGSQRIYAGESGASVLSDEMQDPDILSSPSSASAATSDKKSTQDTNQGDASDTASATSRASSGNRWKYDILEARVVATARAVAVARTWLPRMLKIGVAAREAEKRKAARVGRARNMMGRGGGGGGDRDHHHQSANSNESMDEPPEYQLTAFEVFVTSISPAVTILVEHATFCALGCSNSNAGEDLKMSFGHSADDRLRALLRAPLPPAQSAKCASELADLVDVVQRVAALAGELRPTEVGMMKGAPTSAGGGGGEGGGLGSINESSTSLGGNYDPLNFESPMEECSALAEDAVVTVERRRCIYAFDVCARSCSMRASGSGTFDGDSLLQCVQKLSEELTRPEECAAEVEKGCELVVRRCCEGLASYVRDRGDTARLRAVAECANALNGRIVDVVREVEYLTNGQCDHIEEALADDIMSLEGTLFDEFLDNIRRNVAGCTKLGPSNPSQDEDGNHDDDDEDEEADVVSKTFPPYLSSSLLAIVRCRAQVERALGDTTIRRAQGTTYQFLAMATAADGVVDGICYELNERMARIRGGKAERLASELQFLINTLRKYLSEEMLGVAESWRVLLSKAGRGGEIQGSGPDGLAAIEELERLGRVYVLCLGE